MCACVSAGPAFARGLDVPIIAEGSRGYYIRAIEPLLRLAARDTNRFSDLSDEAGKPQVRRHSLLKLATELFHIKRGDCVRLAACVASV